MKNSIKYYPLNPSQNLLFYGQQFSIFKQVNTLCTSYLLKMDIDDEIMKKAIKAAYKKQECLHVRLKKVNKQTVQYVAEYKDPDIHIVDFSKKTKEKEKKYFEKIAHKNTTKHEKNMNAIYIIHSQDGYNGLSLVVSHLIMDSFAIFAFYKFVMDYYMHFKEGRPAPRDPGSYTALLEKDINYSNSPQYKKDIEFWENYLSGMPHPVYTDIRGPKPLLEKTRKKIPDANYAITYAVDSRAKHHVLKYEKDLVDKLEAYRSSHGVSVQSIIATAMAIHLSALNNTDYITLFVTFARRATLSEKTSGGSRIHVVPFRYIYKQDESFEKTVENAYNMLCNIMHHVNISTLDIYEISGKLHPLPPTAQFHAFAFTYQPLRIAPPVDVPIQMMWYNCGATPQPIYPTIMDGNGTGELHCYYEYQPSRYTPEEISTAHNSFVKILNMAMDDPDITLNEIIKKIK